MIEAKLVQVMKDLGAVGKDQTNKFDKYRFRGIDDLYNSLSPHLINHGVVVAPTVLNQWFDSYTTTGGKTEQRVRLLVQYLFRDSEKSGDEPGASIAAVVIGEGSDRGDKAANKAMSSAFKNAWFQVLCIPTGEKPDSEFGSQGDGEKERLRRNVGKVKDSDDRNPASAPPTGNHERPARTRVLRQ